MTLQSPSFLGWCSCTTLSAECPREHPGSENDNHEVKALDSSNLIKLVLAKVDVLYSNSMIEAWWRSLKHQWLFLNALDTLEAVERLVAFYVVQHNTVIPHSALGGLTPDEVYFGSGTSVVADLAAARLRAQL